MFRRTDARIEAFLDNVMNNNCHERNGAPFGNSEEQLLISRGNFSDQIKEVAYYTYQCATICSPVAAVLAYKYFTQ